MQSTQRTVGVSTDEIARRHKVKPQSVRARLCRTGSYFGMVPTVLANGRLDWPDRLVTAADMPDQQAA